MNPPPGNDSERLISSLLKPMGLAIGQPNFRCDEDVMLALAYVIVATNATVGIDQNGDQPQTEGKSCSSSSTG